MKTVLNSTLVALSLVLFTAGCGDRAVDAVSAINLETGEIKSYPSADKVPAGWASCSNSDCSDFPAVPCQNLGDSVCEKNPSCRLVEDWCTGGGVNCTTPASEGGAGTGTGSDAAPCDETKPEPTCEYKCLAKTPLLCSELTDAGDCNARSDCQMTPGMCPLGPCTPEGDCPPCPETCQAKASDSCEDLGLAACLESSDCTWLAQPCPMCTDPGDACECPSFCQQKTVPSCPTLPTPVACPPTGKSVPQYDAEGCITGYTCQDVCPTTVPTPMCAPGTELVTHYDDNGCITQYECKSASTCGELFDEYNKTIAEAKTCFVGETFAPQCVDMMPSQLACGCETFVNASNGAAVAKLKALKIAWDATTCGKQINCLTLACSPPISATCDGVANQMGTCADVNP